MVPMGRHHRASKHLRQPRPLNRSVHARQEVKADGAHVVRDVPADRAVKTYTCPGCLHPVTPGTPHVVAWPHEPGLFGEPPVSQRRHWHAGCWRSRP